MAENDAQDRKDEARSRAQALITEAMDLLDAYGGSQTAAAHLALALEDLTELGPAQKSSSADALPDTRRTDSAH